MEEVANTGDTCKNHGLPNTRGWEREVVLRDLGVIEKGLPEHLVPGEGGGRDEPVGEEASKAGSIARGTAVLDAQILRPLRGTQQGNTSPRGHRVVEW